MKFPIIEVVDRYAIATVKDCKLGGANKEEVMFYTAQLSAYGLNPHHQLIRELIAHHKKVWQLEDQFKKGTVDSLPLEDIGKMAIEIRDFGKERQRIKNELAKLYNDPVREIKKYGT